MIRLTRISKQQSGPTTLEFETGDRLEIPSGIAHQLDLEEGETYSLGTLETKVDELSRTYLPKAARDHLSRYPKTSSELVEHFTRKGYPKSMVESLLDPLREEGFIDDEEVARQHIRNRIKRKHYGRHKIRAELYDKGFERDRVEQLLEEYYPRGEERERAQSYVEDHEDLSRRKLASRLENRGFDSGIISEVLPE